ncbi:thiamine pyrophosphate-binding protein [Paracoccus sp. SSK6]|uniref:thiamine pyrophosphate-binding protein n=1 Tax=Paracoccus sp. SSK6 TaxID=3143131 RepID=UPI00321B3C98
MWDWGVRHVFGYPGDGIHGLLGALRWRGGDIEFVQVRHEEMAASWPWPMPSSQERSASA